MSRTSLILSFFLPIVALAMAPFAYAGEINYGHIDTIWGNEATVQYKGPWGSQYYVCTSSGKCDEKEETTSLIPSLGGNTTYPHNDQGTYAVRSFFVGAFAYYFLYEVDETSMNKVARIPMLTPAREIKFTPGGKHILFIDVNGNAYIYDIDARHMGVMRPIQTETPFLSVSENGTYVSAYNYTSGHRIWNMKTGLNYTIPSEVPSYVEFSQDEKRAAYLASVEGFDTLMHSYIDKLPTLTTDQVTSPSVTVEDYLFVDNELFFLANTKHALTWTVNHFEGEKSVPLDHTGSYGDFFKRFDGKLAYLSIEGKNTDIVLYDPHDGNSVRIAPRPDSPAEESIIRKSIYIANRYGALLAPKDDRHTDTLFVWLHGGPQRQTSVGYHSYLSYAVYDELMESIAAADNYVLKLDYTGSWGYGNTFMNSLDLNIGKPEIDDIENAVKELKKEYDINHVYLIGNSYGGYLSLKGLAKNPKLYDGAISINGVADWYGLISRIPSSPFAKLFKGEPDLHNLDAYNASEVFTGLKNDVKNQPILVVYAENDNSVPTWQSTNYIEFAQVNNKNIQSLMLPDEEHILRKRDTLETLCKKIRSVFSLDDLSCSQ